MHPAAPSIGMRSAASFKEMQSAAKEAKRLSKRQATTQSSFNRNALSGSCQSECAQLQSRLPRAASRQKQASFNRNAPKRACGKAGEAGFFQPECTQLLLPTGMRPVAKQAATSSKQAEEGFFQSKCTQTSLLESRRSRFLSTGMHPAAPSNRNALSCKAGEAGCHERQVGEAGLFQSECTQTSLLKSRRSRLLSTGMHPAAPFNRNALSCKAGCHEQQAGRNRLLSIEMHPNELAAKQAKQASFNRNAPICSFQSSALSCKAGEAGCHERQVGEAGFFQ